MEDINMNDLLKVAPNSFKSSLYYDCGVINTNHMPHICMTVNAADFVAYSMIPAPYFFGMSSDGVEYERNRLKKKISALVRQIQVKKEGGKISLYKMAFYHVPEYVTLISGMELSSDFVEGISVTVQKNLPQEVTEKICSYNSWERYDGLIYVDPEALQSFIYSIARQRADLPQYGWIKSRIWYNEEVIPHVGK